VAASYLPLVYMGAQGDDQSSQQKNKMIFGHLSK